MNNKVTRNIEKHLLDALRDKENEIDLEIKRYEKLEKKIYDDNDEELEFIKNKRLQELKNKHNENLNLLKKGHGIYKEILSEKEFFEICKNSKNINAEKSPFLCERLKIWCIPTLMLIQNGQTEHSIIGFDELGGDNFSEQTLINVLKKWKLIDSREAED
ncbi:thioredoxin domain containing protein [Plasmodium cynomolgi strain B]|uniref:Thioredoxin domain containing protein n=1 Tax=Plasmodium cynomolgi (strain B) TaxID=1120755 RepID=K6UJK2_PLACD|nr:thioredoxin domain containing protein [Plasmodium cynomolgi strain B]GAB65998.1 thioredoxin domain containing protein [Plasmodium cynomolgi strain B]